MKQEMKDKLVVGQALSDFKRLLDSLEWKSGVGAKGPYERACLEKPSLGDTLYMASEGMQQLLDEISKEDKYRYWTWGTCFYRREKAGL